MMFTNKNKTVFRYKKKVILGLDAIWIFVFHWFVHEPIKVIDLICRNLESLETTKVQLLGKPVVLVQLCQEVWSYCNIWLKVKHLYCLLDLNNREKLKLISLLFFMVSMYIEKFLFCTSMYAILEFQSQSHFFSRMNGYWSLVLTVLLCIFLFVSLCNILLCWLYILHFIKSLCLFIDVCKTT